MGTYDFVPNLAGLERAIEDVDAVVAYAKTQPLFDTSRLVIGGISKGGFLALAYVSRRPNLPVVAVVNFVGGWNNDRGPYDFNGDMLKQFGASTKAPTIWIYGKRDGFHTDHSILRYADKFRQAGGEVSFHFYDHDMRDGHFVLALWRQWVPDMNRFFSQLGYPYLGKR